MGGAARAADTTTSAVVATAASPTATSPIVFQVWASETSAALRSLAKMAAFVFHCVDHVIPAGVERLNQLLGRNLSLVSSLAEISAQTQHVFLIRFRRHALSQLFLVNRYDRLIGGGAQNQFQSLVTGEFVTLTSRTLQPRNGS